MYALICLFGLVLLSHSCLMLVNIKDLKSTNTLKYSIIVSVLVLLIGVIALLMKGLAEIDSLTVNILLLIPFITGIVLFIVRKTNQKKYRKLKISRKRIKNYKKNRGM